MEGAARRERGTLLLFTWRVRNLLNVCYCWVREICWEELGRFAGKSSGFYTPKWRPDSGSDDGTLCFLLVVQITIAYTSAYSF